MRLYSGTSQDFISDSVHNSITEKLKNAYFASYRHEVSPGEMRSWQNSLRSISQVFGAAKFHDQGVILEYELPLSSRRLDCLITGRNEMLIDNAIIIELKQWEKCAEGDGDKVVTFIGGDNRDVLHPSVQVGQYKTYLEDTQAVFNNDNDPISLSACSYLHNYCFQPNDPILSLKFTTVLSEYPLFSSDQVDNLTDFLSTRVYRGQGLYALNRILESKYQPSKKLLDHVGSLLEGKPEYILLDEQLVAYNRVLSEAKKGYSDKKKSVIIVRGGPGTGKSVIALNLLSELSRNGRNTHYVTGSKAFTNTLREIVGRRAAQQIKFFNSYMNAEFNAIDIMICDESHRIRQTSNNRFTPTPKRTNLRQIDELISVAKVIVFFIDDKQIVRPGEIGSTSMIYAAAKANNCRIFDYKLEAQFRCSGSDGFINWVNNTLEIERTANVLWNLKDKFDFQIVGSPNELERIVKDKLKEGNTARMTAGFCWPWSNPQHDGTLVNDITMDNFNRPWNAKSSAGHLAQGIPPENLWAYDPEGVHQVGCIYTAQGFEFDYVGVIFGKDLVYHPGRGWIGNRNESYDTIVRGAGDKFIDLVKNTYRVLLTRGMKGCYVYFMDEETRKFFLSRTESV
jgi:uncharacterized protein